MNNLKDHREKCRARHSKQPTALVDRNGIYYINKRDFITDTKNNFSLGYFKSFKSSGKK